MVHTKPDRKPSDKLLYVNTHLQPSLKKLLSSYEHQQTVKRLFRNSSSIEIFNSAKVEYENALENSGYHSFKLNFTQTRKKN